MAQAMLFHLGEENYGLDISGIREIVEFVQLTPVPKAPNWVEGILNHHGRVVTVLNISSFFDLPSGGGGLKRIAVLDDPSSEVGILLEGPLEMISEWENMTEGFRDSEFMKGRYIEKVLVSGGRVVNILDTGRLIEELEGYFT